MMSLESLIESYGYAALAVGTFLEGETILVIAGFAAHRGYLTLPWVLFVAFLGSLAGDQMWFFLGRAKGIAFITARPKWAHRAERVRSLAARYEIPVLLGFRFLYGLRNVTPLILGASGYRPGRFVILNIAGAALWATVVGCAGYMFGHAIERVLDDAKRFERVLICVLALVGVTIWIVHRMYANRRLGQRDSREGLSHHD